MERPKLREIFWAHRGLLSDKWEQYIPIYEAELGRFVEDGAPVALLEIGVQNGGSLEVWQKLLPPRSRVVGLDIDERCRALTLGDGIEIHIGDATQQDFLDRALGDTRFDIIIDDGSHLAHNIIASFEILFERLKPGGVYIIEDLHTSYWPSWGGGFRAKGAPIEWMKDLIDALNADHIGDAADIPGEMRARLWAFNTQIARIAFFDSVVVVQKYASTKERPFARLWTGAAAPVLDPMDWIAQTPSEKLGNVRIGPEVARHLDAGFKRLLEEKDAEIARQQQALARRENALERQTQKLDKQRQELDDLRRSTSWKITAPLRRAGRLLKSARRRVAALIGAS